MRRYQLATQNDAINLALQMLAAETASIDEARSSRGIGWDADLDAIRSSRATRNLVDTYHRRFGLSGVSNRLTFSKCLTTASPSGCDRPSQPQTPLEDGRRTPRQIENTKVARDLTASQTVSHSQSVSRRRRQPGATARNSFKHPVRTGEERRGKSSTRRCTGILTASQTVSHSQSVSRRRRQPGATPRNSFKHPVKTCEERRGKSRTRRWPENLMVSQTVSPSQSVSRPRRQPGATPRNSFKHPVRTGEERRGKSRTRRWPENLTASQTVSHSQSVSRPSRLRRMLSCLCRS